MSNLKKFFRNKKLVSSALSCLAMLVAFVVLSISLFGGTKAWFAKNKDVGANGMTFATKDDFLSFADTFTAKAIMNHAEIASGTYLRADDGGYYLVGDDGNFALDESGNKRPLSYGSLYPGEYIEVSLKIRCAESRIGTGYRLYFSDLEKSDTFETKSTAEATEKTYSVLGVFRLEVLQSDGSWANKGFLCDYTSDSVIADEFDIVENGVWDKNAMDEDGYITVSFRLYVDLTQYFALDGSLTSNVLSEKKIGIGAVVLAPKEEA